MPEEAPINQEKIHSVPELQELPFAPAEPTPRLNLSANAKLQLKLAAIGVVLFVLSGVVIWQKDWIVQQPQIRPLIPVALLASPSPKPEVVASPSPVAQVDETATPSALFDVYLDPFEKNAFIVQRKMDDGKYKDMLKVDERTVARWKDTLIYPDKNKYKDLMLLTVDLNTLKESPLVTLTDEEVGLSEAGSSLNQLFINGDTLYITLGGYMQEAPVFAMNLAAKTKPKKIGTAHNAIIEDRDGRLLVRGGEGDGCGGGYFFSLLDPTTSTLREVLKTSEGCVEGPGYVAQDAANFYIATHAGTTDPNDVPDAFTVYSDLQQQNIDSGEKKMLLSGSSMPKSIYEMIHFPEQKKLLMMGRETSIYDLATQELKKLMTSNEKALYWSMTNTQGSTTCALKTYAVGEEQKNEQYIIDVAAGTIASAGAECVYDPKAYDQKIFEKNRQKIEQNLKLTDPYRVRYGVPE
jgi:hypothetical protein